MTYRPVRALFALAAALCVTQAACVKKSTHEITLASLSQARIDGDQLREQVASSTPTGMR